MEKCPTRCLNSLHHEDIIQPGEIPHRGEMSDAVVMAVVAS